MTRYFINPNSSSEGAPYVTPDTGAHKPSTLVTNVTLQVDDIVEVMDGTCIETVNTGYPATGHWRPYYLNQNKPTFTSTTSTWFTFTGGSMSGIILGTGIFSIYYDGTTGFTIDGVSSHRVSGQILICDSSSSGTVRIVNCDGVRGSIVESTSGSSVVLEIVNNSFFRFTDRCIDLAQASGSAKIVGNVLDGNNDSHSNVGVHISSAIDSTCDYNTIRRCTSYSGTASGGPHDNSDDPLWVDAANYNFSLNSGSPMIDTGVATDSTIISAPNHDKSWPRHPRPQGSGVDRGSYEYGRAAINRFQDNSVAAGTTVSTLIDSSALVTAIQAAGTDTYFDQTTEISSVAVRYTHQDDRQKKNILHIGSGLTGNVYWTDGARDGTWEKDRVITWDADGATSTLLRADIGSSEDIVMSDGTMTLNT